MGCVQAKPGLLGLPATHLLNQVRQHSEITSTLLLKVKCLSIEYAGGT